MNGYKIREIRRSDNGQVKDLIRSVLTEMGVPKIGTAYEDASLEDMFEAYSGATRAYFVVVNEEGTITGGAGIAPLDNGDKSICELQKMYFLPEVRGKGVGMEMIERCLSFAKEAGYRKCYLETMPYMQHAQRLYRRNGFQPLDGPLGDTGHYNCSVWMIRDL